MKEGPALHRCLQPASLETLYFPFNYSPCRPLHNPTRTAHPGCPRPTWLPPLLFPWSFFSLCLRCTKPAGGGRGKGRGGGKQRNLGWFGGGRTPRFHVCSSGAMGAGSSAKRIRIGEHCKGTPIASPGPTDFDRTRTWTGLGLGWNTVGRLGHGEERTLSSRGTFPKYSPLFLGSPHPLREPGDSLLVREADSNALGFQERSWTWDTASKIRLLTLPCNSIPNPQIHVSPRLPNSPLAPNPQSRDNQGQDSMQLLQGGLPLRSLLLPVLRPPGHSHSRP